MNSKKDILVIGGGLAGLSLAILCAKSGFTVTLIERADYPKHKVCGEYISMESYDFVQRLGVPLDALQLPKINQFVLTSHHGMSADCDLQTGGFGISRYFLDQLLADIATQNGVQLITNQRVTSVDYNSAACRYEVQTMAQQSFEADLVIGAFGRVSGLQQQPSQSDYIGVKYHITAGPPDNTIEIHNFEGGYCGVSRIENGQYCLCYLAKADKLKALKGDIAAFEAQVLSQNPYLKTRLAAPKLMKAVTTSQLHFGVKDNTEQTYPIIGDAAGFIPPITGNGMSLAFRAANVLHRDVLAHFEGKNPQNISALIRRNQSYNAKYLNFRIKQGIFLQKILFIQSSWFNRGLMTALMRVPFLMRLMTKQAVGQKIE